jgi:hypothetical protein
MVNSSNKVRLLVSINDPKNQEYAAIINRYKSDKVEFRCNPGNIGANPNILLGFIFAKESEFLWILSDDDMVSPDALSHVFPQLVPHADLIHIGVYDLSTVDFDVNLENFMTLPRGAGLGMISVGIFNMKTFSYYLQYGFDYLDSSFPHLAITMAALKERKILKIKAANHAAIFTGEVLDTHGSADYSISAVGYGYLADFLPNKLGVIFLKQWLRGNWRGFLSVKEINRVKYYRAVSYLLITRPKLALIIFFMGYAKQLVNLKKLFRFGG